MAGRAGLAESPTSDNLVSSFIRKEHSDLEWKCLTLSGNDVHTLGIYGPEKLGGGCVIDGNLSQSIATKHSQRQATPKFRFT